MISLRDVVMIHDLKKQGLSNTAIAGQLGISRRTVERRLKQGLEAPTYGPRPPKPRLIEPFESYLQDRVTAWPDLLGQRLLREIRERGYRGGYSAVTDFLRDVRPPAVKLHERRYETKSGQQAQVDFAYFEIEFTDTPGTRQVIWLFSIVLGYSRFLWGRFCPNQKLAAVLRCHIDAFADLGGVPEEIYPKEIRIFEAGQRIACHPVLQGKHQSRLDPSHRQAPPRQRAIEIDPVLDRGPSKRPLAFYDAVAQRLATEAVQ